MGSSRARVLSPESIRRIGPDFRESSIHKAWPERRESVCRYRLCEAGPGPAGRPVPESGRCAGAGQQRGPDLAGNRAVGFGAGDRGDSRAAQRGTGVSFQSGHPLLAGAGVPKCGERGDGARSGYCRDTTLPPSLRRYLQRRTGLGPGPRALSPRPRKDPHWAGAHLGLGEIYFQQGKWDQARSEYLAEQATGAMTATAGARLADIALLQGRPAEALRLLSEANQMRPDAAASALGLPALPFADNAPSGEEAKAGYRQSLRVLEKTPSAPARTLALAAVYLRLGLDQESARELARYRATMPSSNPAGNDYERARIEFERHDFDAARSHLAAFLAAHPGDAVARYLLARTCRSLSLSVLATCSRRTRIRPGRTNCWVKPSQGERKTKRPWPSIERWSLRVPRWAGCTSPLASCCGR